MFLSVKMAWIGTKIREYRPIQAKIDNLTAKVLGPKTSETYIVNFFTFYLLTPLQFWGCFWMPWGSGVRTCDFFLSSRPILTKLWRGEVLLVSNLGYYTWVLNLNLVCTCSTSTNSNLVRPCGFRKLLEYSSTLYARSTAVGTNTQNTPLIVCEQSV